MTSQINAFRVIHISPLLYGQENEIADDLRRMHRDCGVTDVAFMMPLMPEEIEPTTAKAEWLSSIFRKTREALAGSGVKVGILIQNTLGHGTPSAALFTRTVNEKGITTPSLCPLAPGLNDYLYRAIAVAASTKPEFMLVDDDFRLSNYGAPGCYCEHHLAAFAQVTGQRFTRETLIQAVAADPKLRQQWDDVRKESLLVSARSIRAAIDAADPKIRCGYCICDAGGMEIHWAHDIEKILAGGNPPFVRLNTSWYWDNDPRHLLDHVYWVSAQAQAMRDMLERLGESDTYPQNRHYTSATALQAQIVFSLLHGCTGLKLWVSRLHDFQPRSGEAYRLMLKKNLPIFRTLRQLMPDVSWNGPVTPLAADLSAWPSGNNSIRWRNWTHTLSRLGIPARVKADPAREIVMLTGPECAYFNDDEITGFLTYGALLDGQAAEQLCRRGFGELLGVNADLPPGWDCSLERFNKHHLNGKSAGKMVTIAALSQGAGIRLEPRSAETQVLSRLYRIPFYGSNEESDVGAGVTIYENRLGGRVAICAAVLGDTPYLDDGRQIQMRGVFEWLNRRSLPLAADTDLDLYIMHGKIANDAGGGELAAFFNLSMDALPELHLHCGDKAPTEITTPDNDGQWEPVPFELGSQNEVVLKTRLEAVTPLLLRIRRET